MPFIKGFMNRNDIRNIAIIAHVDHGKTTLVDAMLRQSRHLPREPGGRRTRHGLQRPGARARHHHPGQEHVGHVRGRRKINIVDTPGHADFGGEVERVLNMVDGVLLLVDAAEGPMPQTRFVLRKALQLGLQPIVVINKIDRRTPARKWSSTKLSTSSLTWARPTSRLEFLISSTPMGWQGRQAAPRMTWSRPSRPSSTRLCACPPRKPHPTNPRSSMATTLAYDDYKGSIVIGRLRSGTLNRAQRVAIVHPDRAPRFGKINEFFVFDGLTRQSVESAAAGDIISMTGLTGVRIGETIADPENPVALPPIAVEEPTVRMAFTVNTSPFAGREGEYVTSRMLRERLYRGAWSATSPCASRRPTAPIPGRSRGAASCTSRSSSKRSAVKGLSSPWASPKSS